MDTLIDPLRDAAFVRGLLDVIVVAIVAGVVGTFIVVRGIGFLGDALAHSIFPGVVIAFLIEANLLVGALIAAVNHDGQATAEELELLRISCSLIHVPMPIMAGHAIVRV